MTQEGECQTELGCQKEEGGEMVGSDRWAKNSACLPAGSEVGAEGRKAASSRRALWKPSGGQGYRMRLR